jgi:hypothetical protein
VFRRCARDLDVPDVVSYSQQVAVTLTRARHTYARAAGHTIRRGLCTHHAAWVNHTENRCQRSRREPALMV